MTAISVPDDAHERARARRNVQASEVRARMDLSDQQKARSTEYRELEVPIRHNHDAIAEIIRTSLSSSGSARNRGRAG